MNALPKKRETLGLIDRYEVKIEGEKAWLMVRDGLLEAIEWENGDKIKIIDPQIDFMAQEQREETLALYQVSRDVLESIEEDGVRPVFTVPREFKDKLLVEGLIPRSTWIKDGNVLASTIGIPYYNKEGNRLLCIPSKKLDFRTLNLVPRLTGKHPAIFQGVVVTESPISANNLIIIDSQNFQVIKNAPDEEQVTIESDIKTVQDHAVAKLRAL